MASKHPALNPYAAYAEDTENKSRFPTQPGGGGGTAASLLADYDNDEDLGNNGEEMDIDEEIDQLFAANPSSTAADGDQDGEAVEVKTFHSTKDVLRYQEEEELRKKIKARAGKRKPKSARVWAPNNQYELVRRGVPLLEDPDAVGKNLNEGNFFYFRHVQVDDGRDVEFASDPHRPLWKAVFKVPPNCGCGPDEYWNPTQANYKVVYGPRILEDGTKDPGRDKPNQPADNMVVMRDGTRLPYWVDEWQRHKDNDQEHKMASRQKKDAQRKVVLPPGPAIRPLQGAMLAWVNTQQPSHGVFNTGAFLKPNPANQMATRMGPGAIRAMKRVPAPAKVATETAIAPTMESQPASALSTAKEGRALLEAAEMARKQYEELQRVEQMHRQLAEERVEFERQKAAYVQQQVPKAKALIKTFHGDVTASTPAPIATPTPAPVQVKAPVVVSKTKVLAGLPPNPLVDGAPVAPVGPVASIRKLKHKFLADLDNGDEGGALIDAEEVLNRFIKYLIATMPDPGWPAKMRKAKHSFLADVEVDGMDAETVVAKFVDHVSRSH